MPLVPIKIRPGVNTQATPTLLEAGFAQSNLIRFRDGLLQKMGGWAKAVQAPFAGICRGLHSWAQLNGFIDLAIGTHLKLFLLQGGQFFDLTPVRASGTSASSFYTTTQGSAAVNVNIAGHGASAGDFFEALTAQTANGVTIAGEYTVASVVDVNNFTITAANPATASGSFGSGTQWQLLLPVGQQDTVFLAGYGTGGYGQGPYGIGTASIFATLCRLWFIDNWGEFMLAAPQNLGIYQWQPSSGTATRASVLTNAPLFNAFMLVAVPQQQVVALGAETGGTQDPLLIRWSDVGNNTSWTATATNQAGSYRLPRGSKIIGGLAAQLSIMVWTDEGLWLMQYIGPPLVYSFTQVGQKCGLIAPKAAAATPGGFFWMDPGFNIYAYGGAVEPVPCLVRDRIFGNCNPAQTNKIFAAVNTQFNEVAWYYPSLNASEIDSYVKYNYVERLWDYGSLARTAWEDRGAFALPMATDPNSFLYNHETGVDADGMPMDCFAQTGYLALGEGDQFMTVKEIVPDFNTFAGQLALSVLTLDHPNSDAPVQAGPFPVAAGATANVTLKARGRGAALRLESNMLGGNFRLGDLRARIAASGRR
jgi:hypothetical protein